MSSQVKENVIVVTAIALCFAITLFAVLLFGGQGIIGAVFKKTESETAYMIAVGGYEDMTLARATAELIKGRGGAGYVLKEDGDVKIFYAAYPTREQAQSVLEKLGENGAFVFEVSIPSPSLKWADEACKRALDYYDIAFDELYSLSNSLNGDESTVDDARNRVKALKGRLEDMKVDFYAAEKGRDDERVTEIKLALVTAIALVENVRLSGQRAEVASSIRYQLVQLVFLRRSLMASL